MTNKKDQRGAARPSEAFEAPTLAPAMPGFSLLLGLSDEALADFPTGTPLNWLCVDCGTDTAPGIPGKVQTLKEIRDKGTSPATYHEGCEVYTVRPSVWQKAGSPSGCLCIGCLEKRIGRRLKPKDFPDDPFAWVPCTPRLASRRGKK